MGKHGHEWPWMGMVGAIAPNQGKMYVLARSSLVAMSDLMTQGNWLFSSLQLVYPERISA